MSGLHAAFDGINWINGLNWFVIVVLADRPTDLRRLIQTVLSLPIIIKFLSVRDTTLQCPVQGACKGNLV